MVGNCIYLVFPWLGIYEVRSTSRVGGQEKSWLGALAGSKIIFLLQISLLMKFTDSLVHECDFSVKNEKVGHVLYNVL